ncbi:MAG: protoheme IX farnesyltransferase [Candidatus Tokpelaia sp.]|nr:MAG: protoheme IX farnesyltransferase [Candidatus Tokpelaia sp.]KAA6206716.1 MAG: protoheme IX farnesyltransferase [Candidatus Tokpelaia sp.]
MAIVTKESVPVDKTAKKEPLQGEAQPAAILRPDGSKAGNYMVLLKPRVMSLVVFTALVGLMAAPPGHITLSQAILAIICIAVGAGASGALNMWYDADIDAVMKRTRGRPIPKGLVSPRQALLYGLVLSVLSVAALGFFVNGLSAFLLAFTIFFYAVIYTIWLKRSTPQNIVIGGAAGAFPPMIGWAAATGEISLSSIVLFLIIFLWTPPHFWALSLFSSDDYKTAQIPMMPNVRGERSTKRQIFVYSVLMALIGVMPSFLGFGGKIYGLCAAVLGLIFVEYARRLLLAQAPAAVIYYARKLFFFSLIYLSLIFAILLTETTITRALEFYDRLA